MFNPRSALLLLALGVVAPVGCGPKEDIDAAAASGVINPKTAMQEGITLLKAASPNYQAAYDKFAAAASADSSYAKAQFNAGWSAERLGKPSVAEGHYRAALAIQPDYKEAILSLGLVLTQQGSATEAGSLYQTYLEKNPTDTETRKLYAQALSADKRYDDAIGQCQEVLREDAKNVGAYRQLSEIYYSQGKFEMSQLTAQKAKTLAEGDAGIYNNMGVTYRLMGDEPAAIKEFQTAVKLDPNNIEANMNLGFVALNSGDYALANDAFAKVVAADPGNIDGKLGYAVALRGMKEYEKAAKIYDEILASSPNNQLAYFNAATLQEKYTKDYKKALKLLETYVAKNNSDGSIGPKHEVYARMDRVKVSQAEEDARIEEGKRKAKEAEERKKRQEEQFVVLKEKVAKLDKMVTTYAECPAMIESGGVEMGMMVLEQGKMVVEANEIDMAADVMTFVDDILPQLEAIVPSCASGAPAPAPAPTPAPAPEGAAPEGAAPPPATPAPTPAPGAGG
jgi:tetratricopeptide (TPR) repeat protein